MFTAARPCELLDQTVGDRRPARRANRLLHRRIWRGHRRGPPGSARSPGAVLVDQMVGHIFRIEDGVITRFDIREA